MLRLVFFDLNSMVDHGNYLSRLGLEIGRLLSVTELIYAFVMEASRPETYRDLILKFPGFSPQFLKFPKKH
ncbi:MAG: hypothetical protein AAGA86_04015 [Bacteroidota bacterium]